jgi:phosphoribosylformylglycinamidine cyclo-ligase
MAVIVSEGEKDAVAAELEAAGETVLEIGRIEAGQRGCTVVGDDNWDSHGEWSATHNA